MSLSSIEGRTRPDRIREDVVKILSEALDEAKSGKVSSIAMVMVRSDGDVETNVSPSDNFYKMLGAVAQLQFNMIAAKHEE